MRRMTHSATTIQHAAALARADEQRRIAAQRRAAAPLIRRPRSRRLLALRLRAVIDITPTKEARQ
jgi:hypothetical protein